MSWASQVWARNARKPFKRQVMVDAHQHFWRFNPLRDAWINDSMHVLRRDFEPDDLRPILQTNGIGSCVAVQADQSEDETLFLLDHAAQNAFIKGIVGWVDLKSDHLDDRLSFFSGYPQLKGFRHIVQGEAAGFLAHPSFRNGVKRLARFGFTYDLLIYHHQLPEAIEFVRSLDGVDIVLDHLGKPPIKSGGVATWAKHIRELAATGNISCKISGMVTEAAWRSWKYEDFVPFLDVVMEAFGPSRVMYGSDWPVCLLSASYQEQLEIVRHYISRLSSDEQEKIMGKNTINFYHL